jgi:glycerophosphoryl diester phosphodiesterase
MKLFGHRGASAREAENTFAALHRALTESDGAEFDVQRTCDGVLVVLHDDTLARTAVAWDLSHYLSEAEYYAVVNAPVNTIAWATLRTIRVGQPHPPFDIDGPVHTLKSLVAKAQAALDISSTSSRNSNSSVNDAGQFMMTLPDALALLVERHPRKGYLIELKHGDRQTAALVARDVVASGATPQQARLIGFDLGTMQLMKQCLPRYHCSHVTHQGSDAAATEALVHAAADAGMDSIDLKADPATVREGEAWYST